MLLYINLHFIKKNMQDKYWTQWPFHFTVVTDATSNKGEKTYLLRKLSIICYRQAFTVQS